MTEIQTIPGQISAILDLMREKLGVRSGDLGHALAKARYRIPRRVYKGGLLLADAQQFLDHPKLRLTLDSEQLNKSAANLTNYLESIDVVDRRKGWWLGMLGGLSFNLIAFGTILLVFLVWRGIL